MNNIEKLSAAMLMLQTLPGMTIEIAKESVATMQPEAISKYLDLMYSKEVTREVSRVTHR